MIFFAHALFTCHQPDLIRGALLPLFQSSQAHALQEQLFDIPGEALIAKFGPNALFLEDCCTDLLDPSGKCDKSHEPRVRQRWHIALAATLYIYQFNAECRVRAIKKCSKIISKGDEKLVGRIYAIKMIKTMINFSQRSLTQLARDLSLNENSLYKSFYLHLFRQGFDGPFAIGYSKNRYCLASMSTKLDYFIPTFKSLCCYDNGDYPSYRDEMISHLKQTLTPSQITFSSITTLPNTLLYGLTKDNWTQIGSYLDGEDRIQLESTARYFSCTLPNWEEVAKKRLLDSWEKAEIKEQLVALVKKSKKSWRQVYRECLILDHFVNKSTQVSTLLKTNYKHGSLFEAFAFSLTDIQLCALKKWTAPDHHEAITAIEYFINASAGFSPPTFMESVAMNSLLIRLFRNNLSWRQSLMRNLLERPSNPISFYNRLSLLFASADPDSFFQEWESLPEGDLKSKFMINLIYSADNRSTPQLQTQLLNRLTKNRNTSAASAHSPL